MYIVIAGAGRVGGELATSMAAEGHDVVVIDRSQATLDLLGKGFNGLTLLGEAYDVDTLAGARVAQASVFCAMTDDDNTNLMAAEVAKVVYGVPRVIARLQDPAREKSYEALGIPHVSTTQIIASVVMEKVLSPDFQPYVSLGGGPVEVIQFVLSDAAGGVSVAEVEVDGEFRVAAVVRGRDTFVPSPTTGLRRGDVIVAAVRRGYRDDIRHLVQAVGS